MNKKAKILFFCMIFVASAAFCQEITGTQRFTRSFFNTVQPSGKEPGFGRYFSKIKNNTTLPAWKGIGAYQASCSVIGADYYTRNFGFFCKKELQFEKATKIPLRFRLGSLQYNDYLEQKPNAVNPF
jgi:hypothetical protein